MAISILGEQYYILSWYQFRAKNFFEEIYEKYMLPISYNLWHISPQVMQLI